MTGILLAHVVQVDLVDTEAGNPTQPLDMDVGISADAHVRANGVGGRLQVPVQRRHQTTPRCLQPLSEARRPSLDDGVVVVRGIGVSLGVELPTQLELDFFGIAFSFVLDTELGAGGHMDTFSRHLNSERLA